MELFEQQQISVYKLKLIAEFVFINGRTHLSFSTNVILCYGILTLL